MLGQPPEASEQTFEKQRLPDTSPEDNWPRKVEGTGEQRDQLEKMDRVGD